LERVHIDMTTIRNALLRGMLCWTVFGPASAINAPQEDMPPKIRAEPQAQRILSQNWEQLLPPAERDHFSLIPPPPLHDYLSNDAATVQSGSSQVNAALDGTGIQLVGFVVPLALTPKGDVSEFFLVPYVGACIHVPPPAPNQMVYVKLSSAMSLQMLYRAYRMSGTMHANARGSNLGRAMYSMDVRHIEPYVD
jgi:uncharacterized protein